MLSLVALVDQWQAIEDGLPDGWGEARLRLTVEDEAQARRAAALLAPANPGLRGRRIGFDVARRGAGSPDLIRRLLARLDAERISGTLELARVGEAPAATKSLRRRPPLAAQWDEAVAALPEDWRDLYVELELASSDYLEPAALRLAPLNPTRVGGKPAFRCRVARRFGYGTSPEMTSRCLERLDAAGIRGQLRILWALSDTKPVYTQGPVWYAGGRAV